MMTYQTLYDGCQTSDGRKLADRLRYLHGFQTEAEESDIEDVHVVETEAMGGC